ncbi:hypothetical protein GCM10027565_07210 [Bordetella tumulicola]
MPDFLLSLAALAGLACLILPPRWGIRIWLTGCCFVACWYLSRMQNDFGEGLIDSVGGGWVSVFTIWGLLGGFAGLMLRAGIGAVLIGDGGFRAPPGRFRDGIDSALAAVAMLPIGSFIISTGSLLLAGSGHPLIWHFGLLVLLVLWGALALFRLRGLWQGITVGLLVSTLWATVDSMHFEQEILANMNSWYDRPGVAKCLGTGAEGRSLTDQRPLMKLTVERPVMLRVLDETELGAQYWSFGDRAFVGLNPPPSMPECQPSETPILP